MLIIKTLFGMNRSMKWQMLIIVSALFTVMVLPFVGYELYRYASAGFNKDYISIYNCSERYGCWDYTDRICRVNNSHPRKQCEKIETINPSK
ncbi:hypothetical protein [Bdellovibrio svalbardensis]|uniref:Uncharacterized protein n=1 Tax=Bdellovibrio svalbardensis TaxID=2972972 RepID=A0ABT6DKG8_9BACT|nr:hypothetical protein [Bdellovibrio svalbardensis]MDG0816695.1 hypothetical protein [Bdellovibrio svalbardensis]